MDTESRFVIIRFLKTCAIHLKLASLFIYFVDSYCYGFDDLYEHL